MIAGMIVDSDVFLDMPQSTQNLYFHLNIRADDDGFIFNINSICRSLKIDVKNINILLKTKLLKEVDENVYLISDWDIHNGKEYLFKKRLTYKYRKWREMVLKRDKYKCQNCYSKTKLEVHHIKSFYGYPDLRMDINNGVTLCKTCHIELHKKERGNK